MKPSQSIGQIIAMTEQEVSEMDHSLFNKDMGSVILDENHNRLDSIPNTEDLKRSANASVFDNILSNLNYSKYDKSEKGKADQSDVNIEDIDNNYLATEVVPSEKKSGRRESSRKVSQQPSKRPS